MNSLAIKKYPGFYSDLNNGKFNIQFNKENQKYKKSANKHSIKIWSRWIIHSRIRDDLIQQYKLHHSIESIACHSKPLVSRVCGRSQLRPEIVKSCNQRYHFYTNRVVNFWNALSDVVVNAKNINEFNNRLDLTTVTGRLLWTTVSAS